MQELAAAALGYLCEYSKITDQHYKVLVTHFIASLLHSGRDDCAIRLIQSSEKLEANSLAIDTATSDTKI